MAGIYILNKETQKALLRLGILLTAGVCAQVGVEILYRMEEM